MKKRIPRRRVALAVGYPSGFEDEIVRGAIDYAQEVGRWGFVAGGHRPFVPFEQIDLGAVDGVMGRFSERRWAGAVERAGVAAVNTSTRHADIPLPRVGNDDEAIGRLGARHLLERGFAHFGFVTESASWYARRRLDGFRQVIARDAGRTCHVLDLSTGQDDVSVLIRRWLKGAPRPIAIMTADDKLGLMALNVAAKLKLRIPEDVAVLGVDNDPWVTALAPVPMSSVVIDARRLGYQAAQLLDDLMAGKPPPSPEWIPPAGVAARRSTDIVVQEDPVVAAALGYIRDHCCESITVDDVLYKIGVSRRTLEMRMKRAIGRAPQTAIFRARIERAENLLLESSRTMGRIAEMCGFERQEQFNRVFKRMTGMTPGQYRQQRHRPARGAGGGGER